MGVFGIMVKAETLLDSNFYGAGSSSGADQGFI